MNKKRVPWLVSLWLLAVASPLIAQQAKPAQTAKQPNIVIIWGDDIGQTDVSAYSMGLMGFHTPNIDRVAKEGMIFTDYYAEQSCTAGRASFITGQSGLRTGLTKVGLPGAALGLQKEDPTIAELLKAVGYATGQFGKNHLGDRNEYLPPSTALMNSTATCTTSMPRKSRRTPTIRKTRPFAPNSAHVACWTARPRQDDPTVDPRFGKVGKQVCTDTGPLTRKRMETIDDDVAARAVDFIRRQNKAGKPPSCG